MKHVRPLCLVALMISLGLLVQACAVTSLASATAQAGGAVIGTSAKATKTVGGAVF